MSTPSRPVSPRPDHVLIALAGLVLALTAWIAIHRERNPPWADAQRNVRDLVSSLVSPEKAQQLPEGVQQLWMPAIDRTDRCITCHQTTDWGEPLANAPHPARSHPRPDLLRTHPPERFGCTLCHGGQGPATTVAAAHGDVAHWEEPMLGAKAAERAGLGPAELMELRCNVCHQHEAHVEGMPLLNEAKALVVRLKCDRCHVIHGTGGSKAPDLTREGDKHPSQFHFPEDWTGPRTAFAWHKAHFLDPEALSPGSEMTKYPLEPKQAAALSLLVMSWRKLDLPADWTPKSGP